MLGLIRSADRYGGRFAFKPIFSILPDSPPHDSRSQSRRGMRHEPASTLTAKRVFFCSSFVCPRVAVNLKFMILKLNSEGIEVANWQRFLHSQGFKIEADGDFGPATKRATEEWQVSVGLTADGIVGKNSFAMAEKVKGKVNLGSQKPAAIPPPTDQANFRRLKEVHPVLTFKASLLLKHAAAEGYTLAVTQGLRTFAEQDVLFTKRPKVTNARGGQSMHNYGLAVDFAFMVDGKISWNEKLYKNIGRWADLVGLDWGGRWKSFKDLPHVQLKGLPSYKVLLPLYKSGGLKAVWEKYKG